MADVDAPVEAPPKKKGKLVLLLPVLALALGGGGGYYQYQRAAAPDAPVEAAAGPVEYGEFATLPGVIVNPAGSGGRRYLMVDLALEADEETVEEVGTREVVIRDVVVRVLGGKTVEELAAIGDREVIKDTLRASVNAVLEGEVDRLYFTQYVIQ